MKDQGTPLAQIPQNILPAPPKCLCPHPLVYPLHAPQSPPSPPQDQHQDLGGSALFRGLPRLLVEGLWGARCLLDLEPPSAFFRGLTHLWVEGLWGVYRVHTHHLIHRLLWGLIRL